jgi:hypothetical protein
VGEKEGQWLTKVKEEIWGVVVNMFIIFMMMEFMK